MSETSPKRDEEGAAREKVRVWMKRHPQAVIEEVLRSIAGVEPNEVFWRWGDDMEARLRLVFSSSGDANLSVVPKQGEAQGLRFCTSGGGGGGMSWRTHAVLRLLALVIPLDNKERPQIHG